MRTNFASVNMCYDKLRFLSKIMYFNLFLSMFHNPQPSVWNCLCNLHSKYVVFCFVSEMLSVDALLFKIQGSRIRSVPCCCFLLGVFLAFYRVLTCTRSAIQQVVYEAALNIWLSVQNPVELDRKSSSFPTKLLFHPCANELRMKCLYVNPQIYMRTFYLISQLAEWP